MTIAPSTGETVLVLGAGFIRAFVPDSPLLTDFYNAEALLDRFAGFPHARGILQREVDQNNDGRINLERLMTRLDSLMPYDYEMNAEMELSLLLRDLKWEFEHKFFKAKQSFRPNEQLLKNLARTCVDHHVNCVTFNYDDILDEYLTAAYGVTFGHAGYWHPDGGYGFYCRPSVSSVNDVAGLAMDRVAMKLLKLHGSINWRVRRGSAPPFGVNDVLHHEAWFPMWKDFNANYLDVQNHLEKEPFIVPPVLTKSILAREPVLRLIWHLAHDELLGAKRVTFVGYSIPATDMAARFLFTEAININTTTIRVVNYAKEETERQLVVDAYKHVFPTITEGQLDFRGAVEWAVDFVQEWPDEGGS